MEMNTGVSKNNIVVSNIRAGFGNQLFQYATGYAVALRNNAVFKVELDFYKKPRYTKLFRLNYLKLNYIEANAEEFKAFKNLDGEVPIIYKVLRKLRIHNKYYRKTHIKDSNGFIPTKKILNAKVPAFIEGYCVKEEYFRDIRKELITLFQPRFPFTDIAEKIKKEIDETISVSIHIRRGDYVDNCLFVTEPIEFYISAIVKIKELLKTPTFFVFSNDIDWAKENLASYKDMNFIDLQNYPDYNGTCDMEDFFLMKSCKHNIIANSSYSWWAAYLNENQNKIVISPKKWYKDKFYQKSLESSQLILKEWIKL